MRHARASEVARHLTQRAVRAFTRSLARNHPLVDGNKRLAWLATVFCAKNGVELDPGDDDAYDLVIAVASGSLDDVERIAATLESVRRPAAR